MIMDDLTKPCNEVCCKCGSANSKLEWIWAGITHCKRPEHFLDSESKKYIKEFDHSNTLWISSMECIKHECQCCGYKWLGPVCSAVKVIV